MKNKFKYLVMLLFAVTVIFVTAQASTSDELANQYYLELYGSKFPNFNSPHTPIDGEGVVSDTTGALCTVTEDYRIKGKNGFDIPIIRSHDTLSTAAVITQEEFINKNETPRNFILHFICSEDGGRVTVHFNNEAELAEADPSFEGRMYSSNGSNFYHSLKKEGTGIFYTLNDPTELPDFDTWYSYYREVSWGAGTDGAFVETDSGFRISKLSITVYDRINYGDRQESYLLFQDIHGKTHPLCLVYDTEEDKKFLRSEPSPETTYTEYTAQYVNNDDVNENAVHPLGFTYTLTLTSDSGIKYYIYSRSTLSYRVVYCEDRYGNGYHINMENGYQLTDSEGNTYRISSSGVSKTCNDEVTQLVSYSDEKIYGEKDIYNKYEIDDEYVFTVKKNSGTGSQISEDEENVTKYYIKRGLEYEYTLHRGTLTAYMLPYRIELPTGLTKHIEYSSIPWIVSDCYSVGVLEGLAYPVSRYYEKDAQGNIRNERTYTYTVETDKKPYNKYISAIDRTDYLNGTDLKTVNSVLDETGRITSQIIKKDSSTYDTYTYKYVNFYSDSKISRIDVTNFADGVTASDYKYYGYFDNYYPIREDHGDYSATYTYHIDGNYIPSTMTYKKDADTTVKTENILTDDKKSIAKTNVYENDVLVKSALYTYDSYGNVSSEKLMLDEDEYILTSYSYDYSPDGGYTLTTRISNLTDADGNPISDIVTVQGYDADHNLISAKDGNGNITTMTYDHVGRLLGTQYPDGSTDSYTYDISEGITTYTAPNGTVYKAYFDMWGNIIKTTVLIDATETKLNTYTYDNMGKVSSYRRYTDADNYVEARYTYDYLGRTLTEKIYDGGNTLIKTTSYTYTLTKDAEGRPLNTVTATVTGDGTQYASRSETTNHRGFLTESRTFTDTQERVNSYTHDYVGNVITARDALGNVTYTEYDGLNNPVCVTYPDQSTEKSKYNLSGLLMQSTDANGNNTDYVYDGAGRVIKTFTPFDGSQRGLTKTYYDPNGNVISQSILSGTNGDKFTVTDYTYDSMNRVCDTVVYPTDTTEIHTRYAYDVMGNPVKVVSGLSSANALEAEGQTVTYAYDSLGRMVRTTTLDGKSETAEYDLQGRLTKSTDKANQNTIFTYDAFDNILTKQTGSEAVTYTYNLLGLRTSMTDSTGTTLYEYSPYGELTKDTKGDIIKTYTYDLNSNPVTFDLNGRVHTYTYDSRNRLKSLNLEGNLVEYTYDANSNLISSSRNGKVYSETGYNGAGLAVFTRFIDNSNDEYYTYYTYTPDGNLVFTMDEDGNTMYYYDDANRLVYENTLGDDFEYSNAFAYDTFGNRISQYHTDYLNNTTENTTYTYNNINQLISQTDSTGVSNFTYDDAGNMISVTKNGSQIRQYTYDPLNRLISANINGSTSSYTYDGDNLRQSKTVNSVTTKHIYNGMNIVLDDDGTNTTLYARGNGLAFVKNGNTVMYYALTPRGDVSKLIGTTTKDYTYTAYGEETGDDDHTLNPFGYTGEYRDLCSGLIYLRNRYYDPSIGRFISEDPIRSGANWYVYANNNPLKYVDPLGLESVIFVANDMETQAEIRKEFYTERYGTDSYKIIISSPKEFVDKWNQWFALCDKLNVEIDAIEIISHGSIEGKVGKDSYGTAYSTGYIYFNDKADRLYARNIKGISNKDRSIEELNSVNAKEMNISSCNGANKDTYNVLYGFMQRVKADKYSGFDGRTQWDSKLGDHIDGGGDYDADRPWYMGGPWYYVKRYQHT